MRAERTPSFMHSRCPLSCHLARPQNNNPQPNGSGVLLSPGLPVVEQVRHADACSQRFPRNRRARLQCRVAKESRHTLEDGTELQLLHQPAHQDKQSPSKPPLLFVHGAYHAAWCWQEQWMPWFSDRGYPTYAVSMRCHGSSGGEKEGGNTLRTHSEDLGHLIRTLPGAPVMIGHSFGGLLLQRYLSSLSYKEQDLPELIGAVLVASGAPSGNKGIVTRLAQKDLFLAIWLSWAFITGGCMRNKSTFTRMFLCPDLQPVLTQRYFDLMRGLKPTGPLVNVRKLQSELPMRAPNPETAPACLVIGGSEDIIMDRHGCQETADWCSGELAFLPDLAHDMMLDARWEVAAQCMLDWLTKIQPKEGKQHAAA